MTLQIKNPIQKINAEYPSLNQESSQEPRLACLPVEIFQYVLRQQLEMEQKYPPLIKNRGVSKLWQHCIDAMLVRDMIVRHSLNIHILCRGQSFSPLIKHLIPNSDPDVLKFAQLLPHPDLDCPKETEQVRLNYFSHTVSEKIIKECAIDQLVVSGDNSLSIQAMLFLNPRLLSLASVKKEHFSSLMNKFSDLKKVTFASTSWLTDELLVNFVKKNPHLTHIEIHEMKDDLLTENGIREMASYCHRLTSLIFLTYPLRKSRLTLSDNTMKSIVDNCKELEIIDIGSRGRKISCFDKIAELPKLKVFRIKSSHCKEGVFSLLSQKTHALTHLSVGSWHNTTDCNACIQKVAESPMKFEELYFNGMTTSSDSAMTALAAKQPSLKKLHLSANYEITDVSLKALADHCPDLEYISLSDCRKITKGGIDYLQSKLPQLKIKR
jgi:hypothetical protein